MRTTRMRSTLAAVVTATLIATQAAWAGVAGVVTAITTRNVTVSGAVYELDEDTRLEDMTGQKIAHSELRPGVPVELEFDAEGRLVTIRAAVVR